MIIISIMEDDQKNHLLINKNLIRRVKQNNKDQEYEGGMSMDMMDMMNEVEVKSKKKRQVKKARICGKQLS